MEQLLHPARLHARAARTAHARDRDVRVHRGYSTEWTLLCAGTVITLAPIILLFVLLQRFFVNGLAGASSNRTI
jgi:ABC-type glycerol-3-phosphate transport system permease component